MTLLIIQCQICDSRIATAESTSLGVPLSGHMFQAPYPERMRHSLLHHTQWPYLRCPTCNHNPFLRDDEVLTTDGIYRIPAQENPLGTTIINPDGSKSIYVKSGADIKVGFVKGAVDNMRSIDTLTTKHLCECCDPPKEFDDDKNRDRHTAMILRWRAKKEAKDV